MVNENTPPDNTGVNMVNGFQFDENQQDGFFKTARLYLEPASSGQHLIGTAIITHQEANDYAYILAKGTAMRSRINRLERSKSPSAPSEKKKKDIIDYSILTFPETVAYYKLALTKSIGGRARTEGTEILTGNFKPTIDRASPQGLLGRRGNKQ
jgi:hypothetical protein